MPTTITLSSASDSIVFGATPDAADGWVYDNVTLDRWYALADVEVDLSSRPNAHGTYAPGQLFTGEHRPIITGQCYKDTPLQALVARNRLSAMFANGTPVTMTVADELVTTSRVVTMIDLDAPFRYDFSHFPFDAVFVSPDPRRYALASVIEAGLPVGSSGLVWDLGTSSTGLFWDWGTPGELGRVAFTNTGSSTTLPIIDVGGPGSFASGFRVTEIETGREVTTVRPTGVGEIIRLDSNTQSAKLAGADITGSLTKRQWFEIPAGATRTYQLTPLGATSGAPTIKLTAATAFM